MKVKFIGLKHISGEKNGKQFAFNVACMTSPMGQRDADRGAVGLDVHTPSVPDRYVDLLSEGNIGKEFDVEFYYANNRENIGYCALAK